MNEFSRTELLIGKDNVEKLSKSKVAVFGVGGVGGYVVETLVRSGVGHIAVIDNDTVSVTNINRQIIATQDTVGKRKVDVIEDRIHSICPTVTVEKYPMFVLQDTAKDFPFENYDYVVDAIDTVAGKLAIVEECTKKNVPVISAMGAGNKLDPTAFKVSDIYKTKVDPLARGMRRQLKARGVKKLKVVYSEEEPKIPQGETDELPKDGKKNVPASIAFLPSVEGLIIGGEVIKDLISK